MYRNSSTLLSSTFSSSSSAAPSPPPPAPPLASLDALPGSTVYLTSLSLGQPSADVPSTNSDLFQIMSFNLPGG